ncbi:hypothetical protein Tco_1430125 [Tanacetum coccineum]
MPSYFVSRVLQALKINYSSMETLILALVHASRRMKSHDINTLTMEIEPGMDIGSGSNVLVESEGHGDEGGGEPWRSLRCLFNLFMAVFGQHLQSFQIVPAFLKELIYRVLELQVFFLELDQFRILLGEREEGQGSSIGPEGFLPSILLLVVIIVVVVIVVVTVVLVVVVVEDESFYEFLGVWQHVWA